MTEEFNKDLLDYITGNVNVSNQKSNVFREKETITNNLLDSLVALNITPAPTLYSLRSDITSNYLVYGQYVAGHTNYSYIAVMDQNGNVLDILTTYESGALIEDIQSLNYDENGNIYGIDYKDNKYRIVLFNNIAVPIGNEYKCRLRNSYYIQEDFEPNVYSENSCIKKVYGESTYFLFGYDITQKKTELIEFSNMVGIPLEWNYYYGKSIGDNYIAQCDYVIENQNNTHTLDIYYRLPGNVSLEHEYFDGESLIAKPTISTPYIPLDIKIEDPTTVYVASRNKTSDTTYTLYVHKLVNGTAQELFNYSVSTSSGSTPAFYISYKDGIIFCKNEAMLGANSYTYTCGAYYNNQFVKSPTYNFTRYFRTTCNVQKVYSLYTFLVQDGNSLNLPNIVIYDNQYSGLSYQNYNSLIPAHSEIYSNGYIKFARDLYNKQVFENQTLAVVNVPNNYLNDMTISPSNLLGQTMTTLINDKREITKNQYENVYINFLNKLNVIDEDINQYYPLTANYINKNINIGTSGNYNISKLTKVRVNFSTPQIINIIWTNYYSYYKTSFQVVIGEEIPTSIDFISEDETTTYITKEYHFHKNTTYTISEKVRIGESLQREELMYNNENVLYDNNQVMVYIKE